MTDVASFENLTRVNGPGREALGKAVARHRSARGWSVAGMERRSGTEPDTGKPRLKRGTIKNLEGTQRAVLDRTLLLVDEVFGWDSETARGILLETADVPPLPRAVRARAKASVVPKRLLAELEGQEVHDMRTFTSTIGGTKLVIALMGPVDDDDLDAINQGVAQLDDLERLFRETE